MAQEVKIGRVSFNDTWKSLKWREFSKQYKPYKDLTGVSAEEAAKKLGVKVPKKDNEGGE